MQKSRSLEKEFQNYWTYRSESYSRQNLEEMNTWKRDAWRKQILSHAPDKKVLNILDVGTGPGFFAVNLALAGHKVSAVDMTEEMLRHARDNARSYGAEVDFYCCRGDALPFLTGTFDLVVSRNVIWNMECPEQALNEWKRVLSPGGRMVYFDANWYLYLYDEVTAGKTAEARARWNEKYPDGHKLDSVVQKEKGAQLEEAARSLPLSREYRPDWDRRVLKQMDMKLISIQEDVGEAVLTDSERLRWQATPLFMVCAEKGDEDY